VQQRGAHRRYQEPEESIMPICHITVPPCHPGSVAPRRTTRRSSQWGIEFGDGGGMPVHPTFPPGVIQRRRRGRAGWTTALAAALALGIAVELLPTRAPEAGVVDAATRAVDAATARMEAAAAHLQRLTQGERS